MENPYLWSNEQLLSSFAKICAEVGSASLCIDVMEGNNRQNARYLKGILLSKLEGIIPPFMPGDKVVSASGKTILYGWKREIKADQVLVVDRIVYIGKNLWEVFFIGFEQRFEATKFKKAE